MNNILPDFIRADLGMPDEVMEYASRNAQSRSNFVGWLELFGPKMIYRSFAFRQHKGKELEVMEIARSVYGETRYVRNIFFTCIAGWSVVYNAKDVYTYSGGYAILRLAKSDHNQWTEWSLDVRCAPANAIILNPSVLAKTDKWKYCGYQASCGDLYSYLDFYDAEPKVEYLGKLGIVPCKSYIRLLKKEAEFSRFIFKNKDIIKKYNTSIVLRAYKTRCSLEAAAKAENIRKRLGKHRLASLSLPFNKIGDYIEAHNIEVASYIDYLKACDYLHECLDDTKVLFPHDFKRMHDLRIDQYSSVVAREQAAKKKELEKEFVSACTLFSPYKYEQGALLLDVPHDLYDLSREGTFLGHCVGKLGYDVKMSAQKTAIFFVRQKNDPTIPYYTVEYDPHKHIIVQCHGKGNCNSTPEVESLLQAWLPIAKKIDLEFFKK